MRHRYNITIYLDMDDVICKFTEKFKNLALQDNYEIKENENKNYDFFIKCIKNYDIFENLIPSDDLKYLIDNIKRIVEEYNINDFEFLTSLGTTDIGLHHIIKCQKYSWLRKHNLKFMNVNFVSRAKEKIFFKPNYNILIDDREDTINRWNNFYNLKDKYSFLPNTIDIENTGILYSYKDDINKLFKKLEKTVIKLIRLQYMEQYL